MIKIEKIKSSLGFIKLIKMLLFTILECMPKSYALFRKNMNSLRFDSLLYTSNLKIAMGEVALTLPVLNFLGGKRHLKM